VLADEITELVHSAAAAKAAAQAGKALFGQAELAELDAVTLEAALSEAGLVKLSKTDLVDGQIPSIVDLFVLAGISPSRGAARRAVEEGGAYLNNTKQTDPEALISPDQLLAGQFLVLRRGKKTMAGIKFELV
jgi:tyrosyl-tRNA synthetase